MGLMETMTVDVPEGESGGVRVERFSVGQGHLGNLRETLRGGRGTKPGKYTRLLEGGRLWMSDTDAEKKDHLEACWKMEKPETRRVLIQGLGLGMVLKVALAQPHITHIDVVEIDERVIELVGPHYADPRLTIYHADAYEQAKKWPTGTHWDVAWHDIWPTMCADHLPDMAKLHRSYGRRTGWQGSWGKEAAERQARESRAEDRRYAEWMS
jgi:hypothetical protein